MFREKSSYSGLFLVAQVIYDDSVFVLVVFVVFFLRRFFPVFNHALRS